jgi:hypothetical protein
LDTATKDTPFLDTAALDTPFLDIALWVLGYPQGQVCRDKQDNSLQSPCPGHSILSNRFGNMPF